MNWFAEEYHFKSALVSPCVVCHIQEQLSTRIMELEEIAKDIRYQKVDKEKSANHHKRLLRECTDRSNITDQLYVHTYIS